MATNITGIHATEIAISGSGGTYNIAKGATVIAAIGISEDAALHDNVINIFGDVQGNTFGVTSDGDDMTVLIAETGRLSGLTGLALSGDGSVARNEGEIWSPSSYAMHATGADAVLRNFGTIVADQGMAVDGLGGLMLNGVGGRIHATGNGFAVAATSGVTRIVNHGVVVAGDGGYAILSDTGNEHVINDGRLFGQVSLGDGADSLDNRGGIIKGLINGGDGDDTLIVSLATDKLTELDGEGTDTVRSTVSYVLSDFVERLVLLGDKAINGTGSLDDNVLHGNDGNNILSGKAGADQLFGHKGNDQLTGGLGDDEFNFYRGNRVDTVTDYQDEHDRIGILNFSDIHNFSQLSSHLVKHGADVWIELGGGDRLVLLDTHKGDLEGTDFFFAT